MIPKGPKRKFARSFNIKDEKAICADYSSGMKLAEVAHKWNSNETVIYRILKAYDIQTSKRKYHYDERLFQIIDNEAKAYFLGYLTTDGYIVEGPKRYVVTLTSVDPDIPYAFANTLGNGIPVYEISQKGQKKRFNVEYRVSACSKLMVQDLVNLGIRQGKSLKETFCAEISEPLLHHYMRGIFDGDGSIGVYSYGHKPQLRFGLVGSQALLDEYALRLHEKVGVPLKKAKLKTKPRLYKISYSGNIIARDICKWLYRDATIFLKRKFEIYNHQKKIQVREWVNANYGHI